MVSATKAELAAELGSLQRSHARAKAKTKRLEKQLAEALEQRTAAGDILRVIASSPTDAQPVFDLIGELAERLCAADVSVVSRFDGELIRLVALHGVAEEGAEVVRRAFPMRPEDETVTARAFRNCAVVHIADVLADPSYSQKGAARAAGYRGCLGVPMVRKGQVIGVIFVARTTAGYFADTQVELLRTFADQAVIAIENVRLFNETKEALERQTATAEILNVIASSPSDVQPVFDAIVQSAARLFAPCDSGIQTLENNFVHLRAAAGPDLSRATWEQVQRLYPLPFDPERNLVSRAIAERRIVEVSDSEAPGMPVTTLEAGRAANFRSLTLVPLLREGECIGAIALSDPKPGFTLTGKQLALVKTFADQAVIAIENVRLFRELEARNRDVTDALERQTATAEILRVMASAPANTQPVFEAIVQSTQRLIAGKSAVLLLRRDPQFVVAAYAGPEIAELPEDVRVAPLDPAKNFPSRAILGGEVLHITDWEGESVPEHERIVAKSFGIKSGLMVPLLREGEGIGAIAVTRGTPGPYYDKEIALLRSFADQAVIAIENVRLFNETREALERQTATAEILRVISESPTDVQPVFDAIVRRARHLIGGVTANATRLEGGMLHLVAFTTTDAAGDEALKSYYPQRVADTWMADPVAAGSARFVSDTETDPRIGERLRALTRARGVRSMIVAPMVREGAAIGTILVTRRDPGPFTDHEVGLLQTFADQAVIAIENVRLFNETREALERQTATAEILKVISSSPTDVQPVFDAIVKSARQLIGGYSAVVTRIVGDELHLAAFTATDSLGFEAVRKFYPVPLSAGQIGNAIRTRAPVCIIDSQTDPGSSPESRELARVRGYRGLLLVPMKREGNVIGLIHVTRRNPGPFSEHQISLVKTFADQAVIAIENVRLFKELEARTEALTRSVGQLTALGEVGQAISSTLDLETVLKTIVSRAVQLTGLDGGSIYEYDERAEEFHLRATENVDAEYLAVLRSTPIRKGEGAVGRAGLTGEPVQIPDIQDASYKTRLRDALIRAGYRAVLVVPLRREEHIIGALSVTRKTSGPFAPEVVDLLKTFATQSAMAIQNARLFREIADKGKQLEEASRHKSDFLASMSHELRTPLNAILGFNEMILGDVYGEVPADLQPPLAQMQTSGKHLLRLINNVLDLAKIEAGRMELSLQDYSVHDTVESVRSTLRPLAADKGLEFLASVPQDIPLAYGDAGRITQCLMNLAGNSLKFTKAGKVEITVECRGELLVYCVADTGIGIPPDKIGSLFTEFKQTDATIASEYGGTGLGLSISRKFVEMHGGRIWVESEIGRGSMFIFEIPLRAGEAEAA